MIILLFQSIAKRARTTETRCAADLYDVRNIGPVINPAGRSLTESFNLLLYTAYYIPLYYTNNKTSSGAYDYGYWYILYIFFQFYFYIPGFIMYTLHFYTNTYITAIYLPIYWYIKIYFRKCMIISRRKTIIGTEPCLT